MDKNRIDHKSGIHLFNLIDFEVRLDFSWLFLAILVTWTLAVGYFPANFPHLSQQVYWMMGVVGTIGLFVSIVLHELCHSLVGRYYGIPIAGITLFIFGGIAEMRDSPPHPKAELLMAIAGPALSIGLGVGFNVLFHFGNYLGWSSAVNGVVTYLSFINFAVGIFNLVPGFPLDGGRILRSILWWWKKDLKWATQIASHAGSGFGFAMILYGIFLFIQGAFIGGLWMFLLGFFLQHISKTSYQEILVQELFRNQKIKKYAKRDLITVPPDVSLEEFVEKYVYRYYHKLYPVTEHAKLLGCVFFNKVNEIERQKWPTLRIRDVMQPDSPEVAIDAEMEVTTALQQMLLQGNHRLMVTSHGDLYGIITLKDLTDVISIRLNLERED